MSAPLRPAALTRTRSSPTCGAGSGWSSTTIEPSRIVAARTAPILSQGRGTTRVALLVHGAHGDVPAGLGGEHERGRRAAVSRRAGERDRLCGGEVRGGDRRARRPDLV